MHGYTRKDFIKLFTKGVGCFAVAASLPVPVLAGTSHAASPNGSDEVHFPQGLASGDPTDSSIVLWTRAVRKNGAADPVPVRLEVSETSSFSELIAQKEVIATQASDFTVRVIVHDLKPDTRYYYRFISGDAVTDVLGRTRTAPSPHSPQKVKIAFASCQSYEGGYYSAYRRLIEEDKQLAPEDQIDFVLHLGDFIYETLGYGDVRKLPEFPSGGGKLGEEVGWARSFAQTLEDYRHLYRHYLMDPDLKEARARWPFVVTWDDHEFTDDSWQGVSTYRTPNDPAQSRKYVSNQAWFEYIPAFLTGLAETTGRESHAHDFKPSEHEVVDAPLQAFNEEGFNLEPNNVTAVESLRIYRSLRWGKFVDLIVTDTRSYRSRHAVPGEIALQISGDARYIAPLELVKISDAGRTWNNGNPPEFIQIGENRIPNLRKEVPAGTILGHRQKAWLKNTLKQSDAVWKVMASSVPMMPMRLDLNAVNPDAANVVFTTDTWEGYLTERAEMLGFLRDEGIRNFISLAGDNHNSFAGLLKDDFESEAGETVGAEFSVCGISSTSVFHALASIVGADDALRPLVTFDARPFGGSNPLMENLNTTFLYGSRAAVAAAQTGSNENLPALRNPNQNPHLRYVDAAAYGIAVAEFDAEKVQNTFLVLHRPDQAEPKEGQLRRKAVLHMPAIQASGAAGPDLTLTSIEGDPPFPL